jgi:tRNA threonylcarbamoyladenosine biosynthesis protein TsaE
MSVVATHSIRTHSRAETAALGASVAPLVRHGDVVILSGELGAGKTALTGGLVAALGSTDRVTSPTFTIMRHHQLGSGGQVLHLDAYRLGGPDDAEDIGLLELLDAGAIAVIEWGERIAAALGPDLLVLELSHVDGDDDARDVRIEARGTRWDGTDLSVVRP